MALRASFTLVAALYIAPRNVQLLCHFPLGKGLSAVETVAQGEDGLLPFWEELDKAIHLLALQAQVHIVQNVDVVGEHVAPCDAVAVLVSVDGVAEIEVMGRLLPAAKMHEDFILNTPAGISGELGPLAVIKGGHRLDEPDGADGDQIFLIPIAGVVFL